VADPSKLTPRPSIRQRVSLGAGRGRDRQKRFKDLVRPTPARISSEYIPARIGSELEGTIRQLLQAGELKLTTGSPGYLNYSMGLPRSRRPEDENRSAFRPRA